MSFISVKNVNVLVGEDPLFQALVQIGCNLCRQYRVPTLNTRGRRGEADKLSTEHRLAPDRAFSVW